MKIKTIRKKLRSFRDSAGFDISADIDRVENVDDAIGILRAHQRWLDDMSNEASGSVDVLIRKLEKERGSEKVKL